jgi:hypothetical protein
MIFSTQVVTFLIHFTDLIKYSVKLASRVNQLKMNKYYMIFQERNNSQASQQSPITGENMPTIANTENKDDGENTDNSIIKDRSNIVPDV